MPIVFRSPLSSSVANATFVDKTVDDFKKGKFSLYKVSDTETEYIDDVQQTIYENKTGLADLDGEAIKNTDDNFDQYDEKEVIADNDIVLINDSEDSGAIKKVKLSNISSGGGGGAGSSVEWVDGDIAPYSEYIDGLTFKVFEKDSEQEMYFSLTIPESYVAGDQISLSEAKVLGLGFSESIKLVTRTYLLDSTDYTDRTNYHDSTNIGAVGDPGTILSNPDMGLTDSSGQINAVSVAPFDTILVRMKRDAVTLSDIKLIKNSPVIKLK